MAPLPSHGGRPPRPTTVGHRRLIQGKLGLSLRRMICYVVASPRFVRIRSLSHECIGLDKTSGLENTYKRHTLCFVARQSGILDGDEMYIALMILLKIQLIPFMHYLAVLTTNLLGRWIMICSWLPQITHISHGSNSILRTVWRQFVEVRCTWARPDMALLRHISVVT
jgi:hypothetical protein